MARADNLKKMKMPTDSMADTDLDMDMAEEGIEDETLAPAEDELGAGEIGAEPRSHGRRC